MLTKIKHYGGKCYTLPVVAQVSHQMYFVPEIASSQQKKLHQTSSAVTHVTEGQLHNDYVPIWNEHCILHVLIIHTLCRNSVHLTPVIKHPIYYCIFLNQVLLSVSPFPDSTIPSILPSMKYRIKVLYKQYICIYKYI